MGQEERYRASGRVRVAVDSLDLNHVHVKGAEQKAMADQALAEFEAKQPPMQIGDGNGFTAPRSNAPIIDAERPRGR